MKIVQTAAATATVLAAGTIGGVSLVNGIFGVYDSTPDELADLLGIDDAPPALVRTVELLRPAYEPLKALAPSCTDALFPEFNDDLDMNDCLLLPRRVLWPGGKPLLIRQTMSTKSMWQSSTGSAVWGGGVTLANYMDTLGPEYWAGKRVIELGTGSGLASINAAKLGATKALATDRDPAVLKLAEDNAGANLRSQRAAFGTAEYNWGDAPPATSASGDTAWDLVIGADLTYNREAWPALVKALKALDAPCLLSASERRANELSSLKAFLSENGLTFELAPNPMPSGYAQQKVAIFKIDRPPPSALEPPGSAAAAPDGGAPAAIDARTQPPAQQQARAATSQQAPAKPLLGAEKGGAGDEAVAAPSAKELAGTLLRYTFNAKDGTLWYEVEPQKKQARIDWAYAAVKAKGYDLREAPAPPAALR